MPERLAPEHDHGTIASHFEIDANSRNYKTQYANIYFLRLAQLKPMLIERANLQWSSHAKHTERVLDVMQGGLTWIIGTIYMDMPLKPQVLQDLLADVSLSAAVPRQPWRDPRRDTIQLEDESGRICIIGNKLLEHTLSTGTVVAVLGSETIGDEFDVIDIIYPGYYSGDPYEQEQSMEPDSPGNIRSIKPAEQYVAFISGLNIHGSDRSSLELDLLLQYLTGELISTGEERSASRISTLIICGNSLKADLSFSDDAMTRRLNKNKKYGYDSASFDPKPSTILDSLLEELCRSMNVVLMPGGSDPTNSTLPQQAINKIMLRHSAHYEGASLTLTTNPVYLQLHNRLLLGTSGQTIDDIAHYISTSPVDLDKPANEADPVDAVDVLDIAECTLKWRHIAPTAPDTLWTYPYSEKDPFILEQYPDIYFIGNQRRFEQRVVHSSGDGAANSEAKACLLLSLPAFSETGQFVLVNTSSLEAELVSIEAGRPGHDDL